MKRFFALLILVALVVYTSFQRLIEESATITDTVPPKLILIDQPRYDSLYEFVFDARFYCKLHDGVTEGRKFYIISDRNISVDWKLWSYDNRIRSILYSNPSIQIWEYDTPTPFICVNDTILEEIGMGSLGWGINIFLDNVLAWHPR